MEMKKTVMIALTAMVLGACSHKSQPVITYGEPTPLPLTSSEPRNVMAHATAFRMSGDYQNNVAITLSPSGEILYYPAPTDITADSEPVELVNGWWLNCQGIGPNSVFTKYTFAQYSALPEVPSPQQLKLEVIPGAKVTDFIELPMTLNEAVENIGEVKAYLGNK